jgi:hypothetical protein
MANQSALKQIALTSGGLTATFRSVFTGALLVQGVMWATGLPSYAR